MWLYLPSATCFCSYWNFKFGIWTHLIKIQKKSMFEIRKTFFRKQNFVSGMDRLGHMGALSRMTPNAYRSGPSGADTERAPNALRRAKSGMALEKSSGIIFLFKIFFYIKLTTDKWSIWWRSMATAVHFCSDIQYNLLL